METVKKNANYTIYKKRSGRFGVLGTNQKWVNGEEKVKILLAEKLIKMPKAKAKPAAEAPATDAPAGEAKTDGSAA